MGLAQQKKLEAHTLNSTEQWLLAETVTSILLEVEELEVEVCYAIGELSVPGGDPGLCIIAKTLRGSVEFIEDRSAQVWLQRLNHTGVSVAALVRLVEGDEPERVARLCIDTLADIHDICTTRYLLH